MAARLRTSNAASFASAYRLHHKPEFDVLYREGRRCSDSFFLALARSNSLTHPRLGLSVPVKAIGNAVNRNRVKRVIRESFRVNIQRMPSIDIVINARAPAKAAPNVVLMQSLEQLWDKLARHA